MRGEGTGIDLTRCGWENLRGRRRGSNLQFQWRDRNERGGDGNRFNEMWMGEFKGEEEGIQPSVSVEGQE